MRALQLPLLSWTLARVISQPIARHDVGGTLWGVLAFVTLVVFTEIVFMYRVRIALRMGESSLAAELFEEARAIHPTGGILKAYCSKTRMLRSVLGSALTERLVGWKRNAMRQRPIG